VHGVEELRAREDPPRLTGESCHELEFGRGQVDPAAGNAHQHPGEVKLDVADAQVLGRGARPIRTSQHCPNTCHQLLGAEGLGDVVVGAELEANQLVGLVRAGGEHDDRHARVAAELSRHVQAVQPRQTEIQHDQVGPAAACEPDGARSLGRGQDLEARVLEVVACQAKDVGRVVDDEDGRHVGHASPL